MKQQSSPRVPASARQSALARQAAAGQRPVRTGCACPAANQPQVRRYTHPIERSAQRAPRCEALQTVLCALAVAGRAALADGAAGAGAEAGASSGAEAAAAARSR